MNNYSERQLGNYRLLKLLGEGGFAYVYLGQHIYLQKQAAIKVLRTRLEKNGLETFLKEARVIASLEHPNIIRVLEFGVDGQEPYLVMDYAMQGSLRHHYPQGMRLPLSVILPYVRQVAEALQYAHERGFVHRDIKPENLLLGSSGNVLLSDFGIATVLQSASQGTGMAGTAAYMAPEQLQGKPGAASDQYALAITTYEWLCGFTPFRGSFAEVCSQHLFVPTPSLLTFDPTIPVSINNVLQTALAKDPQQRFASVRLFAEALAQASNSNGLSQVTPSSPSNFVPPQANSSNSFAQYAPSSSSTFVPPRMDSQGGFSQVAPSSSSTFVPTPAAPANQSAFISSQSTNFISGAERLTPNAQPISQQSGMGYPPVHNSASGFMAPPPPEYLQQNQQGMFNPPPPQYPQKKLSRRMVIGVGGLAVVAVVGSAVGITLSHNQQNNPQTSLITPPAGNTPASANGATSTATTGSSPTPTVTDTTTPSPTDTSTPTSTVTPTPTFANTPIPSNTLLYTSDWSNGFDGWNGDSEWKVSNGMLLSDGNSGNGNNGLINCPYQVPVGDYAIEAQIQTITASNYYNSGTFIFLRGDGSGGGYYIGIGNGSAVIENTNNNTINSKSYNLDTNWHTYRVEARSNGLALYMDGHLYVSAEDNNYITGGQIGLNTPYVQTNVRSFKVYSL